MSRRLDPSGLSGAFSPQSTSSALDFLVPVKEPTPERNGRAASAPVASPRPEAPQWTPAAPEWPREKAPVWQRLPAKVGKAIVRVVLDRLAR